MANLVILTLIARTRFIRRGYCYENSIFTTKSLLFPTLLPDRATTSTPYHHDLLQCFSAIPTSRGTGTTSHSSLHHRRTQNHPWNPCNCHHTTSGRWTTPTGHGDRPGAIHRHSPGNRWTHRAHRQLECDTQPPLIDKQPSIHCKDAALLRVV